MAQDMVESKVAVTATSTETFEHDESHSTYPWLRRGNDGVQSDKAAIPWQGMVGMIGSALTIVCSWALLYSVNDTQQWQDKWPRVAKILTPAAILAAIISVNSIFLHMAFTQGAAVAWWLHAANSKATVGQLHETWLQSNSLLKAVSSGRRFSHVALAAVSIAILSLNGVLLQGALGVQQKLISFPTSGISIPFASDFPSNFTGFLSQSGNLNGISTGFSSLVYRYQSRQNRADIVIDTNVTDTSAQNPAYIYSLDPYLTGCDGACAFEALGVGFHMDCPEPASLLPYDFSVNESYYFWPNLPVVKQGMPIYSVSFDWNVSNPNVIQFNLLSKANYTCSGFYKQLTCTLTAGTVPYQALIQNNQTLQVGQSATLLSMQKNAEWDNPDIVKPIQPNNESASMVTKFGFFAKVFNDVFGSNITLQYSNSSGKAQYALSQTGIYANAPWVIFGPDGTDDSGDYDYSLDIGTEGTRGCEAWIDDNYDPLENDRDTILGNINRLMFYISYRYANQQAWTEADLSHFSPATNMVWRNNYRVIWYHWGGSAAVTLFIVLCVAPMFWGFWRLARTPDMSPLETARAFGAPVLADQNPRLPTEKIIEVVQSRNIHNTSRVEL